MTATSEQSQRPSWKGGVQGAHPGPQEAPVCLPQRQHGEGRALCTNTPHSIIVSAIDLRCSNPQCSRGFI